MALTRDEKIVFKKRQKLLKFKMLKGKKLPKHELKLISKLNIKNEKNPRVKLFLWLKNIYRWLACKW